jgi:hypothetical protein
MKGVPMHQVLKGVGLGLAFNFSYDFLKWVAKKVGINVPL